MISCESAAACDQLAAAMTSGVEPAVTVLAAAAVMVHIARILRMRGISW